jgi:hypothetical protein
VFLLVAFMLRCLRSFSFEIEDGKCIYFHQKHSKVDQSTRDTSVSPSEKSNPHLIKVPLCVLNYPLIALVATVSSLLSLCGALALPYKSPKTLLEKKLKLFLFYHLLEVKTSLGAPHTFPGRELVFNRHVTRSEVKGSLE